VISIFKPIPLKYFLTVVQGNEHHPNKLSGEIRQNDILINRSGCSPLLGYYDRIDMEVTPPPTPGERARSAARAAAREATRDTAPADVSGSAPSAPAGSDPATSAEVPAEIIPPAPTSPGTATRSEGPSLQGPQGAPLPFDDEYGVIANHLKATGPWTTNLLETMHRWEREVVRPLGQNQDPITKHGDFQLTYPLSLMNVYYVDSVVIWDEFNDCVPTAIIADELPF